MRIANIASMKHILTLLTALFLFGIHNSDAKPPLKPKKKEKIKIFHPHAGAIPDTVLVNMFIDHISDINFHDQEYHIDFWVWLTYKDTSFDFKDQLQVPY